MEQHILFLAFLLAAATLFALLEIEIEGPTGWARGLPTWRIENRWTRLVFGARAITGYHVYVQLFLVVLLHAPFAIAFVPFTWATEMRIIAFAFLFWVLEDFLWFVLNPHWGVRSFTRDRIWWHAPNWWWIMPRDYWLFTPAGIALYFLSFRV